MAKVNAEIIHRNAPLSSDFGYEWAVKLFGQEAIDSLPRYQRGKNKGKLKGYVHWDKVVRGGWSRDYGVMRPGELYAWIGEGQFSSRNGAVYGEWLGRTQALAGHSASYLFEEGRERHRREAEQAYKDAMAIREEIEEDIREENDHGFKP